MYVNPSDPTVKAAQAAKKRVHDLNAAKRAADNAARLDKVAKASK
jgi:hypothetical protein